MLSCVADYTEANVFTIIKNSYTALVGVANKAEATAVVAVARGVADVPEGNPRVVIIEEPRAATLHTVRARSRASTCRVA